MRKAIYLNALINVRSSAKDSNLEQTIRNAIESSATPANDDKTVHPVTFEIKRIHSEQAADSSDNKTRNVTVLVYGEGEQEAPENFTELASAELHQLLEIATAKTLSSRLKANIVSIEENTNAVDELADEADQAKAQKE